MPVSRTTIPASPSGVRRGAGGHGLIAGLAVALGVSGAPVAAGQDGPVARAVSEQDRVKTERERGDIRPLRELLSSAQQVGRGSYLGVETGSHVYRFKFRRAGGEVVWVDMDSRSGEVVRVRD